LKERFQPTIVLHSVRERIANDADVIAWPQFEPRRAYGFIPSLKKPLGREKNCEARKESDSGATLAQEAK
jgi:hypothetical protein